MARSDRVLEFIKKTFPKKIEKGAFLTKIPGLGRLIEYMFFEGDTLICLPKNNVVEINRTVEDDKQMVLPSKLVEYFIDKAEHHVIMNFCICRLSMDCKDYPIEYGCLFMGEAVLDINPDWGRRVTREEAKEHIKNCQEKGLIHFIGRSKLDTVWLGIGPMEKLLTVCNCCPCCCITRAIPYVSEDLAEKVIKAPGIHLEVSENCVGCGKCAEKACIFNAIKIENKKAVITDECRGCGRCVETCPTSAITMHIDGEKFLKEATGTISTLVDL